MQGLFVRSCGSTGCLDSIQGCVFLSSIVQALSDNRLLHCRHAAGAVGIDSMEARRWSWRWRRTVVGSLHRVRMSTSMFMYRHTAGAARD